MRYKASKDGYGTKLDSINLTINKKKAEITVNPQSLNLNMKDKTTGTVQISGYKGDATKISVTSDKAAVAEVT